MKVVTFFCLLAVLAAPVAALPFHDCHTDPASVEQEWHEDHGTQTCSNFYYDETTQEWVGIVGSSCDSGCYGGGCPGGIWETHMACGFTGNPANFDTVCTLSGNIVCGPTKTPRTYQLQVYTDGALPVVNVDKFGFDFGGTTCDCGTPQATWESSCGG